MFNSTFADAFSTDNEIIPSVIQPHLTPNQLGTISFPTDSVRYHLNRLKKSRTYKSRKNPVKSPDGFSSHTLHTLGYCLAQQLSSLFTLLFNHGYVPPEWKVAFITPIHKKGARTNPSNYRPISNTSILCRIME